MKDCNQRGRIGYATVEKEIYVSTARIGDLVIACTPIRIHVPLDLDYRMLDHETDRLLYRRGGPG